MPIDGTKRQSTVPPTIRVVYTYHADAKRWGVEVVGVDCENDAVRMFGATVLLAQSLDTNLLPATKAVRWDANKVYEITPAISQDDPDAGYHADVPR